MTRERCAVWAPIPERVDLFIGAENGVPGGTVPMQRHSDGWWTPEPAAIEKATGGAREVSYGYLIDGAEKPVPDPRSRRQPEGVHELSREVDPSQYEWSDGSWRGRPLAGAVIYEMHIGTFTPEGTLDSAIGKLDHLVDLGVDCVELLPVKDFNGTWNWGYDGVLWYAVHEPYGGPDAYRRFVDACHEAGIAVVQDVVYNHLGPSGNYLTQFGPYLHDAAANTWGLSLNLDGEDSDEVRAYVLDNLRMWCEEYHVDGFRLDATHALVDSRATHILEEMQLEIDDVAAQLGKPIWLVAESDLNNPRFFTPRAAGGYGLAGQWSDDFHHAMHVALTGETSGYYADFAEKGALAKVLEKGFFHDGTLSTFRGRHHGRPIDRLTTPTAALVVCTQNHDQIGNRAIGDRLSASCDEGQLIIAATLNICGPFTPMLFMGEEWGATTPWQFFTSHPEKDLGEATAKGRIAEFAKMGWDESQVPDPQDPETFERSKLRWAEADGGSHARILNAYRELTRLRREVPELTSQRFDLVRAEYGDDWVFVDREGVIVVANFAQDSARVPLGHVTDVLFASAELAPGDGFVEVPGHAAAIVRVAAK